jgi:hypothetical protein
LISRGVLSQDGPGISEDLELEVRVPKWMRPEFHGENWGSSLGETRGKHEQILDPNSEISCIFM